MAVKRPQDLEVPHVYHDNLVRDDIVHPDGLSYAEEKRAQNEE
jgi:hypothetical protein